jgi:hypothetical protein
MIPPLKMHLPIVGKRCDVQRNHFHKAFFTGAQPFFAQKNRIWLFGYMVMQFAPGLPSSPTPPVSHLNEVDHQILEKSRVASHLRP